MIIFTILKQLDSPDNRKHCTLCTASGNKLRSMSLLHNTAPRYLKPLDWVADLPGRRALSAPVAWWCRRSDCLRSVVGPSTFLLHEYGMYCLKTLFLRRHYQHSDVDLKPSFTSNHISILLYDCTFGTTVVLEVISVSLETLKITELNWTAQKNGLTQWK